MVFRRKKTLDREFQHSGVFLRKLRKVTLFPPRKFAPLVAVPTTVCFSGVCVFFPSFWHGPPFLGFPTKREHVCLVPEGGWKRWGGGEGESRRWIKGNGGGESTRRKKDSKTLKNMQLKYGMIVPFAVKWIFFLKDRKGKWASPMIVPTRASSGDSAEKETWEKGARLPAYPPGLWGEVQRPYVSLSTVEKFGFLEKTNNLLRLCVCVWGRFLHPASPLRSVPRGEGREGVSKDKPRPPVGFTGKARWLWYALAVPVIGGRTAGGRDPKSSIFSSPRRQSGGNHLESPSCTPFPHEGPRPSEAAGEEGKGGGKAMLLRTASTHTCKVQADYFIVFRL